MNNTTSLSRTMMALGKREFIDQKVAFIYIPAVILGLVLLSYSLALMGAYEGDYELVRVSGDMEKLRTEFGEKTSAVIAAMYAGISVPAMVALPWILYFGFSSALYDERIERSILFYKSMPVADWHEVAIKLVMIGLIGPITFLGVMFAAQIIFAFITSIFVLLNGGPLLMLWPLADMVSIWLGAVVHVFTYFLWALPAFCWVLMVSAASPRVPFLFAALPLIVLGILEGQVFRSHYFAEFIADHVGKGFAETMDAHMGFGFDVDGPHDIAELIHIKTSLAVFAKSLVSGKFWFGIAVAAGFFFGATELRRRAS